MAFGILIAGAGVVTTIVGASLGLPVLAVVGAAVTGAGAVVWPGTHYRRMRRVRVGP